VPNPNRIGQVERFDGLTAQILFILSRAEKIEKFAYIQKEATYIAAKKEFLNNKHFSNWPIDSNDSRIPDPDVRFPQTEFVAEGSTFLWFPWTFVVLTQLMTDNSLTLEERKEASQLRYDILNSNSKKIENYVETNNLMYMQGENLLCVSISLSTTPKT
jgi:hypothetical protein